MKIERLVLAIRLLRFVVVHGFAACVDRVPRDARTTTAEPNWSVTDLIVPSTQILRAELTNRFLDIPNASSG